MAGCPHYVLLSITTKEEYFYKICNNYGVVYSPLAIVKILQSSWLGGHQIHFHESKLIEFVGFLGISYVTFKSVQLIMEIRDGSIKEIKVGKLIQFISFFPTISSGPIDRYKRFVKDDKKVLSGVEYRELVVKAIHMIMLGSYINILLRI